MRKCPRCKENYEEYPSLSRHDNETDICSKCGTEESMIDAGFMDMTDMEFEFIQSIARKQAVAALLRGDIILPEAPMTPEEIERLKKQLYG